MLLMQEVGRGLVKRRVRVEANEVALTILKQMGGGRLKVMIGAKNFSTSEKALGFQFPNPKRSLGNRVRIVLDPSDTYTMEFYNGMKLVKKVDGLHAEDLKKAFEKQTGLYLSL